jgi:hypothetical protein
MNPGRLPVPPYGTRPVEISAVFAVHGRRFLQIRFAEMAARGNFLAKRAWQNRMASSVVQRNKLE